MLKATILSIWQINQRRTNAPTVQCKYQRSKQTNGLPMLWISQRNAANLMSLIDGVWEHREENKLVILCYFSVELKKWKNVWCTLAYRTSCGPAMWDDKRTCVEQEVPLVSLLLRFLCALINKSDSHYGVHHMISSLYIVLSVESTDVNSDKVNCSQAGWLVMSVTKNKLVPPPPFPLYYGNTELLLPPLILEDEVLIM